MPDNAFEENERFLAGLALRKQVLGEEHVERSMEAALDDPFLRPIQHLVESILGLAPLRFCVDQAAASTS